MEINLKCRREKRDLETRLLVAEGEVERQREAHSFWFWMFMLTLSALIIFAITVEFGGTKCS
jgi:hypothetical protein